MKKKRNLLLVIILSILIGWALGFLRIPFLDKNDSFWLGFASCFAVIALLSFLWFIWHKNTSLDQLISSKTVASDANVIHKTRSLLWTSITIFLVLGGLISSLLMYRQNKILKTHAQDLNEKIQIQLSTVKTIRNNNFVLSMSNFFDKIDAEIQANSKDSLSDATIAKIAALSHSYQPYAVAEEDSLARNNLSYERGQLLLGLLKLKMDSSSFDKIKTRATFAEADLRKANLKEVDLSKINLKRANLWGANLMGANLRKANLYWADLRWTELSKSNLSETNLNGAHLTQANMVKTNLTKAKIQWADLGGTILNEANFTDTDLYGTNMMEAVFNQTNLKTANLVKVNVAKEWLNEIKESQIIGAETIRSTYRIVPNKARINKLARFRLEKQKK